MIPYKAYDSLTTLAKASNYCIYVVGTNKFLGECEITHDYVVAHFKLNHGQFMIEYSEEPDFYRTKEEATRAFVLELKNDEL